MSAVYLSSRTLHQPSPPAMSPTCPAPAPPENTTAALAHTYRCRALRCASRQHPLTHTQLRLLGGLLYRTLGTKPDSGAVAVVCAANGAGERVLLVAHHVTYGRSFSVCLDSAARLAFVRLRQARERDSADAESCVVMRIEYPGGYAQCRMPVDRAIALQRALVAVE